MTLRDYFAGQALAIVMARFDSQYRPTLDDIATQSYLIADAMIAERQVKPLAAKAPPFGLPPGSVEGR
jgi:hypothetical protein